MRFSRHRAARLSVLGLFLALPSAACAPAEVGDRALAEATLARADAALQEGRREVALLELKRAVEEAPDWVLARERLGELARSTGDHAAMVESYQFLLERAENDAARSEAALAVAQAALAAGWPETARGTLELLERTHADDPATLLLHAQLAFEEGDYAAADEAARRVLEHRPRATLALHIRGVVLEEQAPREALALYRLALESDPGHLGARSRLALLLEERGEEQEAARQREIHRAISTAMARHFRRRDPELRVRNFSALARELPEWDRAWIEWARALLELEQPEAARAVLQQALAAGADGPALRLMLADALRRLGKPRAAAKHEALAERAGR